MKKICIFICIFAFIVVCTSCTKSMARSIATWENDIAQEYEVQNYKNRLYNYQWFYDQYNACKATANNVKLLEGSERTGTLMVLNSMIGEYNSKASQDITAALWKPKDLPYQITLADFGISLE